MAIIGLALVYDKNNYGTVLQAYATQQALDDLGYKCEVISMDGFSRTLAKKKARYFSRHIFQKDLFKSKKGLAFKIALKQLNYNALKTKMRERADAFSRFVYSNMRFSPAFETIDGLKEYASDEYSAVVVGSDQLWLPPHIEADYYTLSWVPDGIKRLSYATSFGVSEYPEDMLPKAQAFLQAMDAISVREQKGQELVEKYSGMHAQLVCDPTILLGREKWDEVARGSRIFDEKYILCYYLGRMTWNREFARKLRDLTGYKIVALNHMDEYISEDEGYTDYTPFNVGPADFLQLIKDAEYICTDSFHATVFSILFEKSFFTSKRFSDNNRMSTNSRISTLLSSFGLMDRMITPQSDVQKELLKEIDYTGLTQTLYEMRSTSIEYLQTNLPKPTQDRTVIGRSKYECCGCSACVNACPVKCLEMVADQEGYGYPQIIGSDCTQCGKCLSVCPVEKFRPNSDSGLVAYLTQNKDDAVRHRSTSGGFFNAIAQNILMKEGVVYGAAFDDDLVVRHMGICAEDQLYKLNNSKYVQSTLDWQFAEIQQLLKTGKCVCFSGTPCQVEGLKRYLGGDYPNLLLVDVVCRGVPSPRIWELYLNSERKKLGADIDYAYFRDKTRYGYKYTQLRLDSNGRAYLRGGVDWNPYLRSFFSNSNTRPSCFMCAFRTALRNSDITLWDCLDIEKYGVQMDDQGTTRVLIHTQKGLECFNEIKGNLKYVEIEADRAIKGVRELERNKVINSDRDTLFKALQDEHTFAETWKTLYKRSPETYAEHAARIIGARTGLYGVLKKLRGRGR